MTEPIFTHREKCDLIERFNLHCSIEQFDQLITLAGNRALTHVLGANGPAVEIRVLPDDQTEDCK